MERAALVTRLISEALQEDLESVGDITSLSIFTQSDTATALIKAKAQGVVSGLSLIAPIFEAIDTHLKVTLHVQDGDSIEVGTPLCTISGPIIGILSGERLALNLLQHLSGVATATAELVGCIAHTSAKLLDTRKTTPTLRFLEKEAVVHGGGVNHRFGLFDMIMAKDTHVKAAGGPDKAVLRAQQWCKAQGVSVKIEVEVESLEQFYAVVPTAPERIMLDNMSCEAMAEAVLFIKEKGLLIELEASGNVTASTIKAIAETGVDYISVGAITHSVPALDIHLKIQ